MGLAAIYNVPDDARSLAHFAFINRMSHQSIAAAIFTQTNGANIPLPVLDPIPLGNALRTWLVQHQQTHNQQNAILGILGNDLTDVDFTKPEQVSAWIKLHADEHTQAHNILSLGL